MKILSLFDGMSCGQLAINQLGIKNYVYYASEIDKHAMKVTDSNYPNTTFIGSVLDVKIKDGGIENFESGRGQIEHNIYDGNIINSELEGFPKSKSIDDLMSYIIGQLDKYFIIKHN